MRLTRVNLSLGLLAVVAAAMTGVSALAASSTSSAASEGVSASVGSISTSFEKSSASSSGDTKKAEGPYRVVEVAAVEARPGMQRLALKAVDGDHAFALILPQATVDAQRIKAGAVINATPQAYGVQFALTGAAGPFFLVLHDAWFDALKTTRVSI